MENLKNTISLLSAVVSTMDTISVTGIDNQDKFVGCANAVKTALRQLQEYTSTASADEGKKQEDANG